MSIVFTYHVEPENRETLNFHLSWEGGTIWEPVWAPNNFADQADWSDIHRIFVHMEARVRDLRSLGWGAPR